VFRVTHYGLKASC